MSVPSCEPTWPLPRGGTSDAEIRAAFDGFAQRHYPLTFEGGLSLSAVHADRAAQDEPGAERHLGRFRHVMPWVMQAEGGTLAGSRVLDVACNGGFWSVQCALLGAEVVGFDARPEVVEQARLTANIAGVADRTSFRVLDVADMTPDTLGRFDVVLHLGLLYHLPDPASALGAAREMTRSTLALDTTTYPSDAPLVEMRWEESEDVRMATRAGVVAVPSPSSVELMLQHARFETWTRIPVRSETVPRGYRTGKRTAWVARV